MMEPGLNDYSYKILIKMYNSCLSNISDNSKSIILSTIKSKKNTVRDWLSKSKYEANDNNPAIIELLSHDLIRKFDSRSYILTAKGAWVVENVTYNRTINDILDFLDDRFFQLEHEELSDQNRIVLLAMLSARCFSENTCAEYSTEETQEAFYKLLLEAYKFLMDMHIINIPSFENVTQSKTKSKIGTVLGKIDRLPASTYGIFVAKGNSEYYLNIVNDGELLTENIVTLFKILFKNSINLEDIEKITDYCRNMCLRFGYIFHTAGETYSGSEFDTIIEDCIWKAAGV